MTTRAASSPATAEPRSGEGGPVAPTSIGLSGEEAARRLRQNGPNLLPQSDHRHWLRIVWSVIREPMILLLLAAASVYLLLGNPQDAALLAFSVLLVIALTVYQEYKSERALRALRDMSSPRARVVRDGQTVSVAGRDIVQGDVILVAEGDRVPADARLLDESGLLLDESMLTGESTPVCRCPCANLSDDAGTIKAGTLVVRGRATAEVIATGSGTAMGRIGLELRTLRTPPTPMQREMRRAVNFFAMLGLATSVLVTVLYATLRGDWLQGILAGITLAMANIPEEFPVVLTVFLALGAWRMARHRALIRRPPAIEALGSVTVLCTDKTGTLTENRMSVAELVAADVRGTGQPPLAPPLGDLLLCADAASPDQPFDPMEIAIKTATATCGLRERRSWCRLREYPLSSQLLAVTHVWRVPGAAHLRVFCKGAPETIADLCALPADRRAEAMQEVDAMARRGLRVIAAASAEWPDGADTLPTDASGFDFAWSGLVGLADPLRKGAREAVAEARRAGIRVIMLTGDHVETARAIAAQAGIGDRANVLTGRDLDLLGPEALSEQAAATDVFARVKPDHKLRLVEALKQAGQVVAMTGDGVNDAPALVAAHVGVAMGARGTDVAREAASVVLLDDNFVTVVKAIRHGRTVYDNILRAVRYILAVHVPITGLALLPLLSGGPLILLPLHVVFLQLIIDPASTLVFEQEPASDNVMSRPPRPPAQRLLDLPTLLGSLAQGLIVFVAVVAIYATGRGLDIPTPQLAALAFTCLVMGNLGLIVVNRAEVHRLRWWKQSNTAFWVVLAFALTLLSAIVCFPWPGHWFGFSPPPTDLLALAVATPLAGLGLAEAWKALRLHMATRARRT